MPPPLSLLTSRPELFQQICTASPVLFKSLRNTLPSLLTRHSPQTTLLLTNDGGGAVKSPVIFEVQGFEPSKAGLSASVWLKARTAGDNDDAKGKPVVFKVSDADALGLRWKVCNPQ